MYPYLLGVRDPNSTHDDFKKIRAQKLQKYKCYKSQWITIDEDQEKRFSEFSIKKSLIGKDLIRTDRNIEEFEEVRSADMVKLESVLMSYMMYNFDLGYCQGMSDIASVLVQVMQEEDLAFWCFVGFMERIESNFDVNQYGIKVQLQQLKSG